MMDATIQAALEVLRSLEEEVAHASQMAAGQGETFCIAPGELWLSTGATFENQGQGEVSFSFTTSASSQIVTFASGTSQADIIDGLNGLTLGFLATQDASDTARVRLSGTSASAFVCVEQLTSQRRPMIFEAWDSIAAITAACDEGTLKPQVSPADLDFDCSVGSPDLAILLAAWGRSDDPADLDQSGTVDQFDLAILLGAWTTSL